MCSNWKSPIRFKYEWNNPDRFATEKTFGMRLFEDRPVVIESFEIGRSELDFITLSRIYNESDSHRDNKLAVIFINQKEVWFNTCKRDDCDFITSEDAAKEFSSIIESDWALPIRVNMFQMGCFVSFDKETKIIPFNPVGVFKPDPDYTTKQILTNFYPYKDVVQSSTDIHN